MPSAVADARALGVSLPRSRSTVRLRTNACTMAERVKPRMRDQAICQAMAPVTDRAWPIAWSTVTAAALAPGGVGVVP